MTHMKVVPLERFCCEELYIRMWYVSVSPWCVSFLLCSYKFGTQLDRSGLEPSRRATTATPMGLAMHASVQYVQCTYDTSESMHQCL